ncbi:hypothetical protein MPTK1_1g07930 [Marchantia polymorpha subsp. ruderalis]|uniref:Uncharacterized protein n=2 Tax=Marchantia polymorpha TaxID=3197 RepID=A0AAF6AMS0_MARPO|nr:hypothetical protein MARPO_0036s0037 [Marchantia polymorpha]BBM97740.1 hypothetical protein Mp_1g07930 [Marchantia polymorpha subsp. ruderalis]|eukprot:PTQ41043.1 hypothetical protein MARPO_0036s0037 [Marchantia polymorpha]
MLHRADASQMIVECTHQQSNEWFQSEQASIAVVPRHHVVARASELRSSPTRLVGGDSSTSRRSLAGKNRKGMMPFERLYAEEGILIIDVVVWSVPSVRSPEWNAGSMELVPEPRTGTRCEEKDKIDGVSAARRHLFCPSEEQSVSVRSQGGRRGYTTLHRRTTGGPEWDWFHASALAREQGSPGNEYV